MNEGRLTRDKLYGAIRKLAGGTGTLKERLRSALTVEVMTLRADDFPWPDLGQRFDAVINEIAPDRRTHIVLAQWWDFELGHIAEEIVDVYHELSRRLDAE
ncbi:hypothetical protein [Acidisoma sp.]|uniref:hypothetical protein n=1 Tax=Acidisoma sp. TaxID=1872115 RepID=UPI003AFFB2D8